MSCLKFRRKTMIGKVQQLHEISGEPKRTRANLRSKSESRRWFFGDFCEYMDSISSDPVKEEQHHR